MVRRSLALAVVGATLVGCGSPAGEPSESGAEPTKVLVVVEENHTLAQMRAEMPYLTSLADEYGYATRWSALTHPTEPNYLAMVGGSTFGVTDDGPPAENAGQVGDAPSVFGQALAAGRTAGTYAESMPQSCHLRDHPDGYAVRHNPWAYFSAERDACLAHDVDLTTFAADAGSDALPNVGFLIPDVSHDAHDGSLAEADAWLEEQLAPVLASDDFTSGRLAVVITADEDDGSGDNTVLTAVLHAGISHEVVDTPLTVYSLTRFLADVLGVPALGEGRDAPDLRDAFGL